MFPVSVTKLLAEANQVQSVCRGELKLEGTFEGRLSNSVRRTELISDVGLSVLPPQWLTWSLQCGQKMGAL